MNDMWRRWAQRRRLIGVIYLGTAAIGFSVAAFLFITAADNPVQTTVSGMVAGGGGLLIILAHPRIHRGSQVGTTGGTTMTNLRRARS